MNVFISYPKEELSYAIEMHEFLSSLDITPFLDKKDLLPGQDWEAILEENLREADLVILISSRKILERSGTIQKEIKIIIDAIEKHPIGNLYLIPFRVENVHLPKPLSKAQYFDHFDDDWKIKLIRALRLKATQLKDKSVIKSLDKKNDELNAVDKHKNFIVKKNSSYRYNIEAFYPQFIFKNDDYWKYINSGIEFKALTCLYENVRFFENWEIDSDTPEDIKSEYYLSISEFYCSGDLFSLSGSYQSYAVGTMHPNSGTFSLNFGGRTCGAFELRDLFGDNEALANQLLDYCDEDVQKQLALEEEDKDHIDNWSIREYLSPDFGIDAWRLLSHFNFNEKGLTITLSPNDIIPHVLGHRDSFIPWKMIVEDIYEDFGGTEISKLIHRALS